MLNLSDTALHVKLALKLPQGLQITVAGAKGDSVHGGIVVNPVGLKKLIEDAKDGKMRVATFTKRYARCIGAQVNANVSLWFVSNEVSGKLALKQLMPYYT